ncbi:RHS repeat domain-containing protein [Rhodanobacter sp. DHG33]|uniref:RHS repeat domain-containing protein n=1 Tax=Rhodanobacter sp. DHG33 TaxID=2775921 RepID=UPI001783A9DC|nr:RHS repeat domain-containing protein [Rhodanobacter sp. DHG33]MBD8898977.1 RHS repeat protein [Rhodanobacter sp. DHG33]
MRMASRTYRNTKLALSLAMVFCADLAHAAASESTWTRTYNAQGLVEAIDGPRTDVTDVTHYTYDAQGRLATVTDAVGHVTTYGSYDSFGNPGQITDPNGVVTTITYTPQEWPATTTRDSTGTPSAATLTYDEAGDLTRTQDADGVVLTYTYDNARRLTDITDGAGNHIHYTLDAAGNRTKEETFDPSNALTSTISRTFTSLSQLLTLTDALGHKRLSYSYPDGYDAAGHPTHSVDAVGAQHTQRYDALERVISSVDDANGTNAGTQNTTTAFGHDASDNLTSVTDPSNLTTTYSYDGLGHRTGLQSPDTGASADTYDAAGNRLTHTDANGITSTTTYDALNRPTGTAYVDTTLNVGYAYDEANSVTGCTSSAPTGRLTRVVENAVTTVYCYDALGHVIQKRQIMIANTDVTSYAYTPGGRLRQMTEPDSTVVANTYNSLGQLTSVQVTPPSGGIQTVVSDITYRPFGPIASYTLGNGQMVTRTYDATYALTDITSPALNLHFARDAMGRIAAEGNTVGASPANETYHYDALSRLVEVDDSNGNPIQTLTYNTTGDRLSKSGGIYANGAYGYTSDTHQLSSVGNSVRVNDANGNTTGLSNAGLSFGYGYNGRNRLTLTQANGNTVGTYIYNALGERIQKMATQLGTSVTERFAYDEQNHLVGEYGSNARDYVWAGDLPVAVVDSSSVSTTVNYVTADHLGAPRAITNSAGILIWQWIWLNNPFGEQEPTSSTGYTYNLRFPGQYYDAETGLWSNGFRDYDSTTGRYMESDPSGMSGGINTYAYVGGDPIDAVDPAGLRYVDVYIWRAHGSKVGHVMVTEDNSTEVILSQFPANGFIWGKNQKEGFEDTERDEGMAPSEIWRIYVPDDQAFDQAAARERSRYLWSWNPSSFTTQCSIAASRALQAGGVGIDAQTNGVLPPGFFANNLLLHSGPTIQRIH